MSFDKLYQKAIQAFSRNSEEELNSIEKEILNELNISNSFNHKEKRELISLLNAVYFILENILNKKNA
ncbi:MAG: hypothetical protein IPH62_00300 [Ignavibacteriae bacterium]|nr:hypothetical protein [Ignavibacteriota bacterium]